MMVLMATAHPARPFHSLMFFELGELKEGAAAHTRMQQGNLDV
jgi:hypothetical protein